MLTQSAEIYHLGSTYCLYDKTFIPSFSPELLEPGYWQKQNLITTQALGRGITWFVNHQGNELVLRHYYRGGLMGKFIKDSYWFKSYATTRAVVEYHLLAKLISLNLPVPQPVACRVIKKGLFYTTDLLMGRINNAQDLVKLLSEEQLPVELWRKIGATIHKFHQHGIFHHDLNAHNILINDKEEIFLIDFDKGEQRRSKKAWQNANLARLNRSLLKEQKKLPHFNFQETNFTNLLKGYGS
ncbi:MAG: 3-deoxy-D-manno-octulosonic acid kinase [Gammaproteobacteria bacterium]|nr:3-deoxy-D-manno-octulosonic acid kinase [Gammaproteobacteria bacterium]